MKVLIELSKPHYDELRARIDTASRKFWLLTNACVETKIISGRQTLMVQLLCDRNQAETLLELASGIHPGAAQCIKDTLETARHNFIGRARSA
jgi:hypothetical protein